MNTKIKPKEFLFSSLLLALVAHISHLILIGPGLNLYNSDWAMFALMGEEIAEGRFRIFPDGVSYGGLTLAYLRGLLLFISKPLLSNHDSILVFHQWFSFMFIPSICSILAYWAMIPLVESKFARFLPSLTLALGFYFFDHAGGVEHHVFALISGFLLLGWRARIEDPWVSLGKKEWVFLGFFSALSLYTIQTCLPFILAFLVSPDWIKQQWKATTQSKSIYKKSLIYIAYISLGSYIYLELFTGELFKWGEKTVKLHSQPNLYYALGVLFLVWIFSVYKKISKQWIACVSFLVLGGLIGFLPKIYFDYMTPYGSIISGIHNFHELLIGIERLPIAFQELVSGAFIPGRSISTLLFLFAIYSLFSHRSKKLDSIKLAALVILATFFLAKTYSSFGTRYLFSFYVILILALGVLIDKVRHKKILALLFLGLFIHLTHQYTSRIEHIKKLNQEVSLISTTKKLEKIFNEQGISLGISSYHYWTTTNITLLSNRKIDIFPIGFPMHIKNREDELFKQERLIFLNPSQKETHSVMDSVRFNETNYSLTYLETINSIGVYLAQKNL